MTIERNCSGGAFGSPVFLLQRRHVPEESVYTVYSWQLYLLGSLRARRGQETITRFRSQKFGALLAYLALFPRRTHGREALADLLWPEADPEVGRANLRTALASLRRQLEPPGTPAGSALIAGGRTQVSLNPDTIVTDVTQFEAALAAAARAASSSQQIEYLTQAVGHYGGPLLPGFYDDWVITERDRLADAYLRTLGQLIDRHESAGDRGAALDYARRAVASDPLREEGHAAVIRLLIASGQEAAAHRQFDEMDRLLDEQGLTPSAHTRSLLTFSPGNPSIVSDRALPPLPPLPEETAEETPSQLPDAAISPALNLPLLPSRFFGREDEIAALQSLLPAPHSRLITVTGPGGAGKSRLAVEAARGLGNAFPSGIHFVPLADIRGGTQFPDAVAQALGLTLSSDTDTMTQVIAALKAGGPILLILDNLEHLADDIAAPFILPLLEQVETLTILATSRQRLLVEAEHEFPLGPLPTPSHPGTAERLLEFASVQLFVNRARAARADFQLNARNAASVAALCTRLEGIPLAIELAAAWAQTLPPHQMLARMDKRFDLLVSRRRDLSPRHRTMRAAIETSCELLPPPVRAFFASLSVFRGGWTLDAAEAITNLKDEALDFLATLRDHSLIREEETPEGDLRFRMLETLREFAQTEINRTERDALSLQHAGYFANLATQAEENRYTPREVTFLHVLDHENANLRTALSWCRTPDGDAQIGLRLAGSLWWFWMQRGYLSEGRQQIAGALARAESESTVPDKVRARALNGGGCLARLQGDLAAARPLLSDACARFTRAGDEAGRAMTLQNLGIVTQESGDYATALAYYTESLEIRQARNDLKGAANVLNSLGVLAYEQGDYARSRARLEECLTLRRRLGQTPRAAHLVNLGSIAFQEGDLTGARSWLTQAVTCAQQAGQRQVLATAQGALALVATREKDFRLAHEYFVDALSLFLELGDTGSFAQTLEGAAQFALAQAYYEEAAQQLGTAETLREIIALPLPLNEREEYDATVRAVRAALGDTALQRSWSAGRLLTPEQVLQALRTARPLPVRPLQAELPRL